MTNPDVMIPVPFAQSGLKNPINVTRQPDQDAQDATWDAGFPPVTMQRKEVGGLPPNGLDFNGVLHAVSADANHRQKGLSIEFNQDFATAIGGYPVGAKLRLANGAYVESTVAGNTNNPNSSMTGWKFVGAAANLSDLTNAATARTNLGLGTAATATLTTSATDLTVGRVLKTGDFGVGIVNSRSSFAEGISATGFYATYSINPIGTPNGNMGAAVSLSSLTNSTADIFLSIYNSNGNLLSAPRLHFRNGSVGSWIEVRSTANTTVDSNGFIKNASPIVQLFADKIELNDEAQLQEIVFEKLGVGDYLVKGSSGFAQEGWYVETPKDANGNLLVAVVYEQLENGDISVKTYDYMLNNKGRIVADTETPLDIPETRWIDLRLQDEEQP